MKKLVFSLMLLSLLSCSEDSSEENTTDDVTDEMVEGGTEDDIDDSDTVDDGSEDNGEVVVQGDVDISAVVQALYDGNNGVSVEVDAENGVINITSSTGLPDHKSPYYQFYDEQGVDHPLYEDFPVYLSTDAIYENFWNPMIGDAIFSYVEDEDDPYFGEYVITYKNNDNTTIQDIEYVMQIPTHPAEAAVKEETELSAIGMVLNGVPFFNNYNQNSVPLGGADVSTLDTAGGHPGANDDYHYHVGANPGIYADENPEVPYGTSVDGSDLVGFMRDGFPLYGQLEEDGSLPELDEYSGHTGATEHFPDGIYHYHASTDDYLEAGWYVLKAGQYYGTPGTFEDNASGGGMMPPGGGGM